MARVMTKDLDYLAARLHGRRSRLAEAERLDALCQLRNPAELIQAVYPKEELHALTHFQRRLVQDLIWELAGLIQHLDAAGADLLAWMLVRFQLENVKVLLRGFLNHVPFEWLQAHLAVLPHDLALDDQALASATSLEDFIELLPAGPLRKSLKEALSDDAGHSEPFLIEAILDRNYFQELVGRTAVISDEELEAVEPLVLQEVEMFHLMLVLRGKFHNNLAPEVLRPLHVRRGGTTNALFCSMTEAGDLASAAGLALGHALDALPPEPQSNHTSKEMDVASFEALGWNRFLRLANRAFRHGHISLGAVVGYAGIRRVEVANLITLSEGLRLGLAAETIRARLVPRTDVEVVYA